MRTWLMAISALSWLISAVLLMDVWRRKDPAALRAMFVILLLLPILGPFFYLWIRSFPLASNRDLVDQQRYELDVLNRWRNRFEREGWLPRRWSSRSGPGQGRDSTSESESIWNEAQASVAEAKARDAKRERKRLRKARLYMRLSRKR